MAEFGTGRSRASKTYRDGRAPEEPRRHEKGQQRLFDEVRYFFYITNDWDMSAEEIVFEANDRCDQENLIAQLKGGVRALAAPGGQPAEQLGVHGDDGAGVEPEGVVGAVRCRSTAAGARSIARRNGQLLRMEFRTFLNAFIKIPCQILRTGRKMVYRVLGVQPVAARVLPALDPAAPLRC